MPQHLICPMIGHGLLTLLISSFSCKGVLWTVVGIIIFMDIYLESDGGFSPASLFIPTSFGHLGEYGNCFLRVICLHGLSALYAWLDFLSKFMQMWCRNYPLLYM